jgi:hypothetical protein
MKASFNFLVKTEFLVLNHVILYRITFTFKSFRVTHATISFRRLSGRNSWMKIEKVSSPKFSNYLEIYLLNDLIFIEILDACIADL